MKSFAAMRRRNLCFVATIPFAVNAFLRPHLAALSKDANLTVCSSIDESDISLDVPDGVRVISIPIAREIDIWRDMVCLWRLIAIFRRERFDMVFSMTPKAGLLSMFAGLLSGVSCRIHCFTGQVWVTRRGVVRAVLKGIDKFVVKCATFLLADSDSQRKFLVAEQVVSPEKISVLGFGSIAGVDLDRFHPDEAIRFEVRNELGLSPQAVCLLFVGRLTREKGIDDLLTAFNRLASRYADLHLLLVGPDECGFDSRLQPSRRLHRINYTTAPERYMMAADIFCLPSYREGFGSVLIEAAAVGLPVVASRIYGISDAVVAGETGLLHPAGDIDALSSQIELLLKDKQRMRQMGEQGRERASALFEVEILTDAMSDFIARECPR